MPRNHNPGASTLRNRNRVTNKTRLKILRGNIDADPLVLDEDEEKARVISTAGVDAEDANEHHLQEVLSAATQRNQNGAQRSTRGATEKNEPAPAFIPVPDSTGIVDNYEELYPPKKWEDSATYVRSSETVDECCENALANQFTYVMDERDKDWLEKNNEDARGEGTSAQGAISNMGTTTRSGMSSRSAKARGKEPDVALPMVVTDDEFELVMGLFEKITHEKTEYLHHGLEQGMTFPPFTDYQDAFSLPLQPPVFASFTVPTWIPAPEQLTRIARLIYPYWRERRTERGGHRIIPALNFDESDTLNESYICFRRREVKSARKTRASQVTSSDKLIRLDNELFTALELAGHVVKREMTKQDVSAQGQHVWEKRLAVVELKRKFPGLGIKEDDELLFDKERVPKRPKMENGANRIGLKLRAPGDLSSPTHVEMIRPKERTAMIKSQMEQILLRLKERDHQWEDQVDNLYQPQPVPFSSRLFKYIPSSAEARSPLSDTTDDSQTTPNARSVRLRYGRGGRLMVDRRYALGRSSIRSLPQPRYRPSADSELDEDEESEWRLHDKWKYDADDLPSVGPEGADEQDRVLIDDYEPRFLRQTMTLLHDQDSLALMTDPTLHLQTADGRYQAVVPFRLGPQQPIIRRDPQRQYPPSGTVPSISSAAQQPGAAMSLPLIGNTTPISVQTQMKNMQPPAALPQMRISSNGGMKPPSQPMVTNIQPQQQSPLSGTTATNGASVVNRTAGATSDNDEAGSPASHSAPNANGVPSQSDNNLVPSNNSNLRRLNSPSPSKTHNPHHVVMPNGYPLAAMNGYPMPNGSPFPRHMNTGPNGLSIQQMQNLKSAFASVPPGQDVNGVQVNGQRLPASWNPNGGHFNMQLGTGANMNMKLPSARWNESSPQRPSSTLNGMEGGPVNGSMTPSPRLAHSVPLRTPSASGGLRGVSVGHVIPGMSPHGQHSPSMIQAQIHSSPRPPQTPSITMASPSSQHLQPVGGANGGYS